MSLSSNTAQTRELTELRNHLKWLDEERRKSTRKMAELEQRLAQQGRELSDRDQKIQELEWHVANFAERFEHLPDHEANTAGTEQRLQDLEWHLSNMNAQLTRLPNMEEERARLQDELARAVSASQERVESGQSLLESRLRAEIVSVRDAGEQRNLAIQLEEQVHTIDEMEQKMAALQESVGILSAQLRERTNSLAAESQANFSSLAAGVQDHLDTITADNQSRLDSFAAEWQARIQEMSVARTDEPSPELLRLDAQLAEVHDAQQQWALRWSHFDQLNAQVEQLSTHLAQRDAQLADFDTRLTQRDVQLADFDTQLAQRGPQFEQWEVQFREHEAQLRQQVDMLAEQFTALGNRVAPLAERQMELEDSLNKLGHVREVMPLLDRLEQELELRQAEEVRLSNLIGTQENRFAPLAASLEEMNESTSSLLSRVADSERLIEELRAGVRDFNDNWKPTISEANRRITPIAERVNVLSNNIMKAEAGIQALSGDQSELREIVVNLTDDMQRNQSDITRQLEGWQATLDENKDTIERFTQQWITLSNQYKEARMAVQNFAHWQKQLEQQKREASEMLRVESNRMQSRWDGFLMEIQEKLKNFEIDLNQKWQAFEIENEQKWSAARRNDQIRHEELAAVDDLIQKLQQDNRNLIWRVQAAQADAIKKWPRLLMEEVEKAVEINPNRRLSSAAAPRNDMSVVDAIEQGLITIDYNDDPGLDL
jgi:chromosome segregation ATPase